MQSIVTIAWILGSIVFSISIIMVNKTLMSTYGYHSPMFLTTFHFFLTFSLLEIMCRMGLITRATQMPSKDKWVIGSTSIIAVVFQNFNLMYNSVGFYQLSKLCSIPFMVVYNFLVEHQKTPGNILFSLSFLLIGLALFTVNDVSFNLLGTIMATIAVSSGSLNQLFTKSFQVKYSINGPTLQHAASLPSAINCLIASCIFELSGPHSIFTNPWSPMVVILAIVSGLLAVGTNICAFGLIGKTNAITFSVVGHVKTMLIFIFGLVIFKNINTTKEQLQKQIIGLVVAMTGVILYTFFEMKNKKPAPPKPEEKSSDPDFHEGVSFKESVDEDEQSPVI